MLQAAPEAIPRAACRVRWRFFTTNGRVFRIFLVLVGRIATDADIRFYPESIMHLRLRLLALGATIAILASAPLCAQSSRAGGRPPGGALDTVRLLYDLDPGESVTYRVVTYDTLYFQGGNEFLQAAERSYHVTYRCDSVTRDGIAMSMIFEGYAAREWRDSLPPITRTSHPWTNRSFAFLMNSDGRRIRFISALDTPGVAPSGPFQPMLLPFLGSEWSYVGASNTFELNHWLLDNVMPSILFSGSVFRTVAARRDTLGVPTIELTFAEAGRATYKAENGTETLAIVNTESIIWHSPMLGVAVAGELHSGDKLQLRAPDGSAADGVQLVSTYFQMVGGDDVLHSIAR